MFGGSKLNEYRPHDPSGRSYTLAARIKGKLAAPPAPAGPDGKPDPKAAQPKSAEANVILVGDLDMISDQFFELRKRPSENMDYLDFDNVAFILNCVDSLAGDDSFIALRKRRPKHRTLTAVEAESEAYIKKSQEDSKKAEDQAKKELDEAQKRLDAKVEAVRDDKSMDDRTKAIALENLQQVENRRLTVTKAAIEDNKRREIAESKAAKEQAIGRIQSRIKALAILIPPLPALFLGAIVFAVRKSKEDRHAGPNRLA
jgi:ABC-2 type transport system permease protein